MKVTDGGRCLSHCTIITNSGYGPPVGRCGPLRPHSSAALPEQRPAGKKLWKHNVIGGSVAWLRSGITKPDSTLDWQVHAFSLNKLRLGAWGAKA